MNKLPKDYGFDGKKFPKFRENQLEVATQIANSSKYLNLLEAPTGSGKSFLGMLIHKLLEGSRAIYLVSNKQLQDQIIEDFKIPVLKGRANYPCLLHPDKFHNDEVTAADCSAFGGSHDCNYGSRKITDEYGTEVPHPDNGKCPYMKAKRIAVNAPICLLNYSLFLIETFYVGEFSGVDCLILDECDTVEDHLLSFVSLRISANKIKELKLGVPESEIDVVKWTEWLKKTQKIVLDKMGELDVMNHLSLLKKYRSLENLSGNIDDVLNEIVDDDSRWILEIIEDYKGDKEIIFQPVKVDGFAQERLWKHARRAVGMSATIMGAEFMGADLGIEKQDIESISLTSPFSIDSRLIQYSPVANVTYKTKLEAHPKLVAEIINIMDRHKGENILVHAVSYELCKYIVSHLPRTKHTIMTHKTNDRIKVLDKFKKAKGAILVSPSMDRGVNLADDACRVVIVAKVPYISLGSKQVKKRLYEYSDGNLWYARKTARSLIQMTGRATRSNKDWSISYILDSQLKGLHGRNKHIFPDWWMESVRGLSG